MFSYEIAFSRTVGWVSLYEQQVLRSKRVAIAGLGGVGGYHLLTLTRLGVAAFNLAEFDQFELANFNRQAGATMSTIGKSKLDVMVASAREVNPEIDVRVFPNGVTATNIDEFLADVDLFVDGLDFFVLDVRSIVFAAAHKRGIPAITVAPLGMGASLVNFLPGQMSFEAYFGLEGQQTIEQIIRFFVGLSPSRLQSSYLVEPKSVDFVNRRGPSTPMACYLCAGVMGSEALKILLGRGRIYAAPWVVHYDAYRNRLSKTYRIGGYRNPLQSITRAIARRLVNALPTVSNEVRHQRPTVNSTILRVLDIARWAPSGDNTQPWRFEVVSDEHVVIHGFDTRSHCVYDLDGHASQISLGALMQTMAIAASQFSLEVRIQRRSDSPEHLPMFDVYFSPNPDIAPHPLLGMVEHRTVNRRNLSRRHLSANDKAAIQESVGADYELVWFEGFQAQVTIVRLLWTVAKIRLTMREAYNVHSSVIEWAAQFSESKVPANAIGLDAATLHLMQWVMGDWKRVEFFNRFLAGTVMPRIQLDVMPGLFCGAHFILVAKREPSFIDDYIAAGSAIQRLWLTATGKGIQHQPALTPIIFARYGRTNRHFSSQDDMLPRVQEIASRMNQILGEGVARRAVWMGRLGYGALSTSRSLRLPLETLLKWEDVAPSQET